jgi:Lhr-like helicase
MRVNPQGVMEMANRDLEKRLAAIEQVITGGVAELIFVPTRQLAARAERALAKLYAHRKFRLVCLPVDDVDGSVEAELREHNPREAARLDAMLEGRIPTE